MWIISLSSSVFSYPYSFSGKTDFLLFFVLFNGAAKTQTPLGEDSLTEDGNKALKVRKSVIQIEVSQKEKNKYSMLTHIYGI